MSNQETLNSSTTDVIKDKSNSVVPNYINEGLRIYGGVRQIKGESGFWYDLDDNDNLI